MIQSYDFSLFYPAKDEYPFSCKVTKFDELMQEFGTLDKRFNISYNYQLKLFKNGISNKWEDPANKRGARFIIYFQSAISAVRTFCLFSFFWMNQTFEFSSNIVGLIASVKQTKYTIQIWIDDGFDANKLPERYRILLDWMKNVANIKEEQIQIQFILHPNYRILRNLTGASAYMSLKNELRVQAIQIPSFQYCISRLKSNECISQAYEPKFDLKVATTYKRTRKERRANPSYVDNITKG